MAEVIRQMTWDEKGDPMMILRKKRQALTTVKSDRKSHPSFAIQMNDIWMFSQDHNPNFIVWMGQSAMLICEVLQLGISTTSRMSAIATIIEEGIDDLIKMKPRQEINKTVGEVTTRIGKGEDGYIEFTQDFEVSIPI